MHIVTQMAVIRGTFHVVFIVAFSLSILYIAINIVDFNNDADYRYSLIIIIQHKIIKLKTSIKTTWLVHHMTGPLVLYKPASPQQTWLSSVLVYVFLHLMLTSLNCQFIHSQFSRQSFVFSSYVVAYSLSAVGSSAK